MIYAIIPLEDLEQLPEQVQKIDQRAFLDEGPVIFFASFDGTSQELFKELFHEETEKPACLILRVHEHYGIASAQLWEWLSVRANGN